MISQENKLDDFSDEELTRLMNIPEGYSGEEEDPGKVMSVILHISVYIFPFLFLGTLFYSLKNMYETHSLWTMAITFPIAWLLGDFVTGIVHWLCDTYGTVNTPLFGQTLIRNFRSHHKYPKDICISPFVYTVGYVALVAAFTLPLAIYYMTKFPSSIAIAVSCFTYTLVTFLTVLTNQFHKWAHLESEKVSSSIKLLQKYKIILNPEHHKIHHTNPFDSNYCITHGLNNPFLEKIKFFRNVEFLLSKIGFKPSVY